MLTNKSPFLKPPVIPTMFQPESELSQMDDLMDKLKLLSYEKLLLKGLRLKPPNRRYFEKSRNPGEQFFMFTAICAWLARNLGKDFEQPQEFDDPSATIAKIIRLLQDMVSQLINSLPE